MNTSSQPTTLQRWSTKLSTLGPIGFLPKAPGTWGSATAIILAPFLFMPHSLLVRSTILVLLFLFGSLAATQAEHVLGRKDPGCIILDEVLGQWVTLLPFSILPTWQVLAGFVFFRLFDITKPFPIRRAERFFPAGWGVMADDVLAGVYAAIALWIARGIYVTLVVKWMGGSM